jgi:altronate hydrolase
MASALDHIAVVVRPDVDNVAALVAPHLPFGESVRMPDGGEIALPQPLRKGQSFALRHIAAGSAVVSLGAPYGIARRDIRAGERVDAENVAAELPKEIWSGALKSAGSRKSAPRPAATHALPGFRGYRRADGRVGIRNLVAVVTSGMCAATEVREIALRAQRELYSRERYPNVDGVVPVIQESGCGMPDGRAVQILNRLLQGVLDHPNIGAALYVDLGCGKTCIECSAPVFKSNIERYGERVMNLGIQASGGTRRTVERGLDMVNEMLTRANCAERHEAGLENLLLGVKCGGSDRWSGITANPALGWAADRIVEAGGAVLIGEVPELQGAATVELMRRARNREIAKKLRQAQTRYAAYVRKFGEDFRENPSPGNIEGGLSNIYLKSLGALAKSGSSTVEDVLDYGEPAGGRRGLMVVYSPGYDQLSVPALFLAGAQITCFTTGRGTGIGSAMGPVIKISSNSELAQANEDIDVDAGPILSRAVSGNGGGATIEDVGRQILARVVETASGDYIPKAEASGLHYEFKIWESLWPAL